MNQFQVGAWVQIKKNCELFWCRVLYIDTDTGTVTGVVENELVNNPDTPIGSRLHFHERDVLDAYSERDLAAFVRHLRETGRPSPQTVKSGLDFAVLLQVWLDWRSQHRTQQ